MLPILMNTLYSNKNFKDCRNHITFSIKKKFGSWLKHQNLIENELWRPKLRNPYVDRPWPAQQRSFWRWNFRDKSILKAWPFLKNQKAGPESIR